MSLNNLKISGRRGDVPLILLFLVALVLSISALFIFASYSNNINSQSLEFSSLSRELEFKQNYIIMQASVAAKKAIESRGDLMDSYRKEVRKNDLIVEGSGNFFLKIENKEFSFVENIEGYTLRVERLFVASKRGHNSIQRNFNLIIEFDKSGNIRKVLTGRV